MRRALLLALLLVPGCERPDDGAPRPVAPLSTSRVTSWRPTFRWALPAGAAAARLELCADPACTAVLETLDASGTSATPSIDLPPGPVFWRLFARRGDVLATDASATWEIFVPRRSAPVSTSWQTTLDVNRDGHPDLAVVAPSEAGSTGAVFVYLGSASGIDATSVVVLTPPPPLYAEAVASAGDVNGDGFGDLAVGSGASMYLYLGSAEGVTPTALVVATDDAGAVAGAGDVNGDGFADLAIGRAIHFGSPSGTLAVASVRLDGDGALLSFSDVNGDGHPDAVFVTGSGLAIARGDGVGFGITHGLSGPAGATFFGFALATTADVNADGHADVVVGSLGHAYVYLGPIGSSVLDPPPLVLDALGATAFGDVVGSAGDADGDGYDDLVIGDDDFGTSPGAAYFYRGGPDGLASSVASSFTGAEMNARFGASVGSPGDVDGDGYAELVIGAPGADGASGRVFVFIGNDSGPAMPRAALLTETDERGDYGALVIP